MFFCGHSVAVSHITVVHMYKFVSAQHAAADHLLFHYKLLVHFIAES